MTQEPDPKERGCLTCPGLPGPWWKSGVPRSFLGELRRSLTVRHQGTVRHGISYKNGEFLGDSDWGLDGTSWKFTKHHLFQGKFHHDLNALLHRWHLLDNWVLTVEKRVNEPRNIDMVVSIIMGVPPIAGWFNGKSKSKMDENWGYPHFRKAPYEWEL